MTSLTHSEGRVPSIGLPKQAQLVEVRRWQWVATDGGVAFVTSANLTQAAMEWNMELGVLSPGGKVPLQLERHLEALITTKRLRVI